MFAAKTRLLQQNIMPVSGKPVEAQTSATHRPWGGSCAVTIYHTLPLWQLYNQANHSGCQPHTAVALQPLQGHAHRESLPLLSFGCDTPGSTSTVPLFRTPWLAQSPPAMHVHLTALWHHMTSYDITLHQHTNRTRLAAVSKWEHHYMWLTLSNMPTGPKTLLNSLASLTVRNATGHKREDKSKDQIQRYHVCDWCTRWLVVQNWVWDLS